MGCEASNLMLFQQLKHPSTPPFLGLLELPAEMKARAIKRTKVFLGGSAEMIPRLFRNYTYLSGWLVTHVLHDAYGEDGHAVYRLLEDILGVPMSQTARQHLRHGFQRVCDKLGLPNKGFDRFVDLYLLHAGVSRSQLPHLIAAFNRQYDVFGAPPLGSSTLLNRWEDDALDFLPPSVITMRRAIIWDETAWHASLYARIVAAPESYQPASQSEQAFFECFKEVGAATIRSASTPAALPRPRLVWGAEGLALRLPRAQGRTAVWVDGETRPVRLKGGDDWLTGEPWPKQFRCEIDGHISVVDFLADSERFAVFDMTDGTLLVESPVGLERAVELDTTDALITARRAFEVDGEHSLALGDDCFALRVQLVSKPKTLSISQRNVLVCTKPRRRLIVLGGEIAAGTTTKLFGPLAMVQVETGLGISESRKLRVHSSGGSWFVDVDVIEGIGRVVMSACFGEHLVSDPQKLQIELMAPSIGGDEPRPSGISVAAFVWPGFISIDGLSVRSSFPPENFLAEQSTHVFKTPDGLRLEGTGGYMHATAAFGIDGEVTKVRLPWPDVALQRIREDGNKHPLQIGARISVGTNDRFGHISVRCPDRTASLRVGARLETSPFAVSATRTITISDLLGQGTNGTVVLQRSNGAELLLFEVVNTLEPKSFTLRPVREGLEITLTLATTIEAIALEVEDELGRRDFHAVSFGRWQMPSPPPRWLSAILSQRDGCTTKVKVDLSNGNDGVRIGRLFVSSGVSAADQQWRPLRNARGDTFAVPLTVAHGVSGAPTDNIKARFNTLNRWMSDCYSAESWQDHGLERTLLPRWRTLGKTISELPLGSAILIEAALAPSSDETSTSWVPLIHPIEIDAGIFAAAPTAFLSLTELSNDCLRVASKLVTLDNEKLHDGLLHAQALFSFENRAQAELTGEALRGFRPTRFFSYFAPFDTRPSAGWFWNGSPLLGPDHLRACFQRYIERLEEARIFINEESETGGNSRRRDQLRLLLAFVWSAADVERRPVMPKRNVDDDRPVQADIWVATTLSEFARASRTGSAREFVEKTAAALNWREADVLSSIGFLLRLSPELFFYFLLVWQLAKVRA